LGSISAAGICFYWSTQPAERNATAHFKAITASRRYASGDAGSSADRLHRESNFDRAGSANHIPMDRA
jgi:hypothetical protein